MKMRKNPCLLRCYGKPQGDKYVGICIDLDIAVEGRDLPEVRKKMSEVITLYMESLNKDNACNLFLRRSPLHVFLDYYIVCSIVLCSKLFSAIRDRFQIFREQLIFEKISVCPCV